MLLLKNELSLQIQVIKQRDQPSPDLQSTALESTNHHADRERSDELVSGQTPRGLQADTHTNRLYDIQQTSRGMRHTFVIDMLMMFVQKHKTVFI